MPSKWEKASTIAQCIQALAVAVTLIFIAYQLYQQAYQLEQQAILSRAANVQSLAESMTTLNMKISEREIAQLWQYSDEISGISDERERTIKEAQYTSLLANLLLFYENVYSQHQAGLLPEHIYLGWDMDLKDLISDQPVENYWEIWRHAYLGDFRNRVDELVKAKRATASPSPSASPLAAP